jgi:hypothetical protein
MVLQKLVNRVDSFKKAFFKMVYGKKQKAKKLGIILPVAALGTSFSVKMMLNCSVSSVQFDQ